MTEINIIKSLIPLGFHNHHCLGSRTVAICKGQGLTRIPSDLSAELQELDLSFNRLEVLSNHAFLPYPKLERLRLNNNHIYNVSDLAFEGLNKLRSLNISYNRIGDHSITSNAFHHIGQLKSLAIQGNSYTSYSKACISQLTKLRTLQVDIFWNFQFSEEFLAIKNLRYLHMHPRNNFFIHNSSFSGLRNSRINNLHLNFPWYVLRPIGNDYLRPFQHLKNLRVNFGGENGIRNVLRSLTGLSYRNMTSIDMEYNILGYASSVTLTDLHLDALGSICVRRINLSRNRIVQIRSDHFWSSTASRCLEDFEMRGNNIELFVTFKVFIMARFEKIRKLNVGFEPLNENDELKFPKEADSFNVKPLLAKHINLGSKINYTLHMSETLVEFDGDGVHTPLRNFYNYSRIHLMATGLKTLNIGNTNFSFCEVHYPYFIRIHANVTKLDMSGWFCVHLNPTFLFDMGCFFKLKILLARDSQLDRGFERDKDGVFLKGLNNIMVIDLSNNKLTYIHDNFFKDQIHTLHKIFLGQNQFSSIPSAVLDIKDLRELHFQDNLFSTFTRREREVIDRWKEITLDFRRNLFSCICAELETLKWIVKNKHKFNFFSELMCQNEIGLQVILDDIHNFEIRCVSREWLIISVSLFLMVSIVMIGAAVLYRYRFSACFYFLQARKYFKNDTFDGFKYDVFISYTPNDEFSSKWTVHTLYPFLTNNMQMEVSLEEKTFSLGLPYVDNVHDMMDQSRNIVVVFSNEFRKFAWCRCHLEMARMHSFHKGRSSMVVILLDDTSREELPHILRSAWWKIEFIYWPNDDMELEKRCLFWQQLKMVLRN